MAKSGAGYSCQRLSGGDVKDGKLTDFRRHGLQHPAARIRRRQALGLGLQGILAGEQRAERHQ